jgi:peptidoglycan/LPS O-acetylase OafA/YrhL
MTGSRPSSSTRSVEKPTEGGRKQNDLSHKFEFPSLDLLRGMMATVVFLSHAAIWTGNVPRLHMIFNAGGLAVDIFMFISGFLMLWHYQHHEGKESLGKLNTWKRFWI